MPSAARRRLLLALSALLAPVVGLAAAAVVHRDDDPAPVAQDRPGTVLLVPGYGGSTEALEAFAEQPRAAGRSAAVIQAPGDGRGDLRETARVLAGAASQALEAGAPSVDVVGYSAGGIVARWWVAEMGGHAVARRVITVGSPHHGMDIAVLGADAGSCPPGCQQLATDSDLLRTLNARDETPEGPLWTTVWTDQDDVVLPPDSSRLEGATEVLVQQVCPGTTIGHADLAHAPVATAAVLESLAVQPPPASYGPGDCSRLSS